MSYTYLPLGFKELKIFVVKFLIKIKKNVLLTFALSCNKAKNMTVKQQILERADLSLPLKYSFVFRFMSTSSELRETVT